jgi:aspartyl-tRNA(Asn)/glutamyl-tRNA(Gln) amidotransferase subunit C
MASKITGKEVKKLSLLGRIFVSEKETKKLQKDLEKILDFVSKLEELDVATSDVDAQIFDVGEKMLRKDENPLEGVEYGEALLKQAPEIKNGYVKARKVF